MIWGTETHFSQTIMRIEYCDEGGTLRVFHSFQKKLAGSGQMGLGHVQESSYLVHAHPHTLRRQPRCLPRLSLVDLHFY